MCICGSAPSLSSCRSLSTQPWTTSPPWKSGDDSRRPGRYCLAFTAGSFSECEEGYPHPLPLLAVLQGEVVWSSCNLAECKFWRMILNFTLSALCWLVSLASRRKVLPGGFLYEGFLALFSPAVTLTLKRRGWCANYILSWRWWWWRVCVCEPLKPVQSLWPHELPGSSIHGILLAGIPEWVAFPFSRRSSWPRD